MSHELDEPAFPIVHPDGTGVQYFGLSMRDYFAARLIPALIAAGGPASVGRDHRDSNLNFAMAAYAMADAMLEVRSKL